MKSLLSLSLMILILSSSNAYSQKKFNISGVTDSVETFIHDIFDKDKRAERKAIRIEKRKIRRQKRQARLDLREQNAKQPVHQHNTPVVSKPVVKPVVVKEESCSISDSMMPKCYHKRDKSELKIALLYYGDYMQMSDLDRIAPILKERFASATGHLVTVDIVSKKILDFKHKLPEDYTFNNITDKKRLQRIWYSENVGTQIMNEVYEQYKKYESKEVMDQLDAVVAITGAQFEGLGFASGRISVTEYPREIAWGLPDGGRVDYISDYQIVDELIHELGHNMYLGHTSNQCQKRGMTYKEVQACCALSDSKDDVLSYCRNRADVNESFMHGFESCNREAIESKVVPAILSGGKWSLENTSSCQ
jgi:hypothetical protein